MNLPDKFIYIGGSLVNICTIESIKGVHEYTYVTCISGETYISRSESPDEFVERLKQAWGVKE